MIARRNLALVSCVSKWRVPIQEIVEDFFRLIQTNGLIGGMTVQFAEGHWPGELGAGLAMTDEAFDIVEPELAAAAQGWTPMHRYGVFKLEAAARGEVRLRLLRRAAEMEALGNLAQATMLTELAAWLNERLDERQAVSVFGY